MQAESKGSFAVIRYNLRTYESGGVMAVIKGKESAEAVLKQFEQSQASEDRHIGWRYFLEKTDLKAGMDPVEASAFVRTLVKKNEFRPPAQHTAEIRESHWRPNHRTRSGFRHVQE